MSKEKIHLVGGGLVGALTAIYLAQRGFHVALHERRPDMRKNVISAGRSINLAVTSRGLKALQEVGLKQDVLKMAVPMKGRMLHDIEGNTTLVPYGQTQEEVINSVSRGDLNKLLLTKAESYPGVEIFFNRRCTSYEQESGKLVFQDENASKQDIVHAAVVIGTDGSGSVIRGAVQQFHRDFQYSEDVCAHGYKELEIPPAPGGGFLMEKQALHVWPRKNFMLIALPNMDGSFTVTFFFPHKGSESFESLNDAKKVEAFFKTNFADAMQLMPSLAKDFFENPTGSMITVKCRPWHIEGKAMLMGDAAHAIVPFFGQGMNCGFEDASALGELLDRGETDWGRIFSQLEAIRKPSGDAIADMALENFIEMRDTVADPKFQLKKQIGFELEKRYPGRFIPRYAMVVFHPEISYAEARRRSFIQETVLDALATGTTSTDAVDWHKAEKLVAGLKF